MIAKVLEWNGDEVFVKKSEDPSTNTITFETNYIILSMEGESRSYEVEYIEEEIHIIDETILFINTFGYIEIVYTPGQEVDIFVVNKCNSNCIMCPLSEGVRKQKRQGHDKWLNDYIEVLPGDVGFINVTGGEPTLAGEYFYDVMERLKVKFQHTEFQLLTNGRTLSNKEIYNRVLEVSPQYMRFSIPIHSSDPLIHDEITRANGSFQQTDIGIKRLLNDGEKVEIRIVLSRYNIESIHETVNYIIENYIGLLCVTFIGMEMMGNAALNRELLWVDYDAAFEKIRDAIKDLITSGIDVLIYNFPLCAIEEDYWPIAVRSITESKIRYMEECNKCRVKSICGGLFSSTKDVITPHVYPILE